MIVDSGATSQSVDIQIVDDAGLPVTGLVAATFPAMKYSIAGANADVAFPSLSDLATLTTSYSSGGVKERGEGVYRLDVPDTAFAAAGRVKIRGEDTDKHVLVDTIDVAPAVNATRLSGTAQTARDIGASVLISSGTGTGQVSLSSGAVLLQATQTGVTIPNVTTVNAVTGNVGGSVGSVAGNVSGSVASVVGAVGSVVSNVTADLVTAPNATALNAIADATLDRTAGVETNRTLRQSLRLMLATLVGKVSGGGTSTVTIRDSNDSKNRVVATVDADGNRSAVTLDQT